MAQKATAMDVRMAAAVAGGVGNVSAFCAAQGISRQTFYKWRRRVAAEGVAGLQERSRRPGSCPGAVSAAVEERVLRVRKELADGGWDHGPDPIRWALQRAGLGLAVPSRATVARILARRGLSRSQPSKRPRSSMHRFTYPRPNECWQSDWTWWQLADGQRVAIAGTLDDHSRYLPALAAGLGEGSAGLVWAVMSTAIARCGVPARSLTDNGLVYSGARRGSTVAFEANLNALGTATIASRPYHPQTCGKIERFWQTLKKWLRAQPPAAGLDELNTALEQFRVYYNEKRPHRALRGATPAEAFTATVKAQPAARPLPGQLVHSTHTVNSNGVLPVGSFHVSVGRRWHGHHVDVFTQGTSCAIFSGNRLVRHFTLDPTRRYQPTDRPRYDLRGHREPQPT